MEHQLQAHKKFLTILQHANFGIVEIDASGRIIYINTKATGLLKPVMPPGDDEQSLYPMLTQLVPAVMKAIEDTPDDAGHVLINDPQQFHDRLYSFSIAKVYAGCIMLLISDITPHDQNEPAMRELLADKALADGKLEVASNILHDIGNAVVGFGSHITRIKRTFEQSGPENLQKVIEFITLQQPAMESAIGIDKAGALIKLLSSIREAQKSSQDEIRRSVTDQLSIISHIQEILHIQRQYSNGTRSKENVPVKFRSIVNDCISMLYASIEKRNIHVSIDISDKLPDLMGDRTRLMQVILNILKNSIEAIDVYADTKTISITVAACNGSFIISVQDSGQGFDSHTHTQLFTRGFTTKASGSGVGLSSCKSIIESHGGTISITSPGVGKGALTTIHLQSNTQSK